MGHKKTHLARNDYEERPENMRGALPESSDEGEGEDNNNSSQTPAAAEGSIQNNLSGEMNENFFPTFTFQELI